MEGGTSITCAARGLDRRLRSLLLLGFVAGGLIAAVALMWRTIDAERAQRVQAARTTAVLIAVRVIMRDATNGETGQRGYLITGDRRYLAPYLAAREQYRPDLARLRTLIGDQPGPRLRELLDRIDTLAAARFALLEESVALIASGKVLEARRAVMTNQGQEIMERLRHAVSELEQLESGALASSSAQAEAAEARIVPLLGGLLVLILVALGLGLTQIIRAADAEARAEGAAELELARDRAALLARELNHRVRNLFAVILAIIRMSRKGASPEGAALAERIAERINALLNAHEVTQGNGADSGARLDQLLEPALRPYRSDDHRAELDGPPVRLPDLAIVPLGLVFNELATNAVKYGAWSQPGGLVAVQWRLEDGRLRLEWAEHCTGAGPAEPPEPEHRGFGTALIDGSARQLRGTIERRFEAHGVVVRIDLPIAV